MIIQPRKTPAMHVLCKRNKEIKAELRKFDRMRTPQTRQLLFGWSLWIPLDRRPLTFMLVSCMHAPNATTYSRLPRDWDILSPCHSQSDERTW